MCYLVGMRLHLRRKRKPPIADGKPTHVRVSRRAKERLEECFKLSGVKTQQQMLDNLIRSYSEQLGAEPMLEKRWRATGKRKAKSKASRDGRQE